MYALVITYRPIHKVWQVGASFIVKLRENWNKLRLARVFVDLLGNYWALGSDSAGSIVGLLFVPTVTDY